MMFKIRRSRGGRTRPDRRSSGAKTGFNWRRLTDLLLLVVAALVVVYAVSVAGTALTGYTLVRPTPLSSIRLQLVNASGDSTALAAAVKDIKTVVDRELALEIVETSIFDIREVSQSFVVSRQENPRAARVLAERLGLDPGEVEYRPLANNRRQITTTLVLGSAGLTPVTAISQVEEI